MAWNTEATTILVTDIVTGTNDNETTTIAATTTTTPVQTTSAILIVTPKDDTESIEIRSAIASVLTAICVASLVLNIITLFVLTKAPQWKKSANYLLINITVADLLMTLLWGIPAIIVAASWEWSLGDGFCRFHEFIGTWCHVVVIHTFIALGVEKLMLFWRPSKHKEVFYPTVVLVLIAGIWLFDLVIALFPFMGWGVVAYSPYQFQCAEDYKHSYSLLNFNFVVIYLIPIIAIIALYSIVIHKVRKVRSRISPGKDGKLVLEEDKNVPHESYGQKYAKQQRKYKAFGKQQKKSVMSPGKSENKGNEKENHLGGQDDGYESNRQDDGHESNSKNDDESSNDEGPQDYETLYEKKKASLKKRVYLFKEQEFKFALTIFFVTLAYFCCWLPLLVISYYWAYNFETPPSNVMIESFTCLTFFGLCVKPILYVINKQVRKSIRQAVIKHEESTTQKSNPKAAETEKNKEAADSFKNSAVDVTEPGNGEI